MREMYSSCAALHILIFVIIHLTSEERGIFGRGRSCSAVTAFYKGESQDTYG